MQTIGFSLAIVRVEKKTGAELKGKGYNIVIKKGKVNVKGKGISKINSLYGFKAMEEIGLRTAISKAYSDLLDRAENFGFKNEVFLPKLAEKNLLY